MEELTAKQKRFCEEYLLDLNATQAAIRAGYSEKTANEQGAQNLAKLSIGQYIAELQKQRSERTKITTDKVLTELAKIAFSNITEVVEDKNGLTVKPLSTLDTNITAAVVEISEQHTLYGINRKVKMHPKLTALQMLGQHLGMFNDKATGGTLPPVTDKDETERE